MSTIETDRKPTRAKENLVRAMPPGEYVIREATDKHGAPQMVGHFAVTNQWTEVDSMWEGHFMERNATGAFVKTIDEKGARMKVTLNHGGDPELGDKVLGTIDDLREDDIGAAYAVDLFPSVPPLVMEGLRAGVYGSSYRFRVLREEWVDDPGVSDHNPKGLPERTVKEAEVPEFGPVTFPQYEGATAGVRSMTDEVMFGHLTTDPAKLAAIIDYHRQQTSQPPTPASTTSATDRDIKLADIPTADKSEPPPPEPDPKPTEEPKEGTMQDLDRFNSVELLAARRDEIDVRRQYLNAEAKGLPFGADVQEEWDDLKAERAEIEGRITHLEERQAELDAIEIKPKRVESGDGATGGQTRTRERAPVKGPENPFDLVAYRQTASNEEDEARMVRDGFRRALDSSPFPQLKGLTTEEQREKAWNTLETVSDNEDEAPRATALAAYFLAVGSPTYRRAFGKFADAAPSVAMLGPDEAHAIQQGKKYAERAFTLGTTGIPIPFQLDPTVVPISNSSVNPLRAISRVEQTTVNNWRSATSAGITAHYDTEALEATDDTPTLAQPTINAVRATAFVPFSIESQQDWPALEAEMTQEVADAKDDLEAVKFTLGSGTNEPFGLITGATTLVITTTTGTFVAADIPKLEEALGPRFRARGSMVASRFILNKVRQFDTAGGATNWLPYPGLAQGLNNQVPTPGNVGAGIFGYPTYEDSAMDAVLTTGSEIIVFGDFRYFVIVDRIGMSVDLIPHLVGTNHRPTGQRGLYYFWRNGSKVLNAAAFRTLQT